jgi:hypothetical protein
MEISAQIDDGHLDLLSRMLHLARRRRCFRVRGNHRFTQEEKAEAESEAIDARCHDAGAVET